jgi:predicted DCC family thiol-disulfide oxidoreductase YuxK
MRSKFGTAFIPRGVYSEQMKSFPRPLFLFDGDCGVCQKGTDSIRENAKPDVDMVAHQSVDLAEYGVTQADVNEGPVLVRTDGTHVVGPLAMAEVLRASTGGFRAMGQIMTAPGIRQALRALGPVMYRNRSRLPGANETCRIN